MSAHTKKTGGVSPKGRNEGYMMNTSEAVAVTRPGAAPAQRLVLMLATLAAAGLIACEGDNLFSGDGPSLQPRVLEINTPSTVFAGETVSIRIDAVAARQVSQISVSVRGAANADTVVKIDDERQQVSEVIKVVLPAVLQDSLLTISAEVVDAAGARSQSRQVSVPAFGPPVVTSVSGPGGVRAGDNITVRVRAFGARGVSRLDIVASGAIDTTTSVAVTPAAASVTRDIVFKIPNVVNDTVITFSVTAHDDVSASSPSVGLVPLAIDPPSVELIAPPTVEAGHVLNLAVRAHSLRKVTEVGIELWGGTGNVVHRFPIGPPRATTEQYLTIQLPQSLTIPEIGVRAYVLDLANVRSETAPQTVTVPSSAPSVISVVPTVFGSGPVAGQPLDVRVVASGERAIKELKVRWRGFAVDSLEAPETVKTIAPPRINVTEDFSVVTPCIADGGTIWMLVTARDEDDRLSAVFVRSVSFSGNPDCIPPVEEEEGPSTRPWTMPSVLKQNR
jgi:hypothetical protein